MILYITTNKLKLKMSAKNSICKNENIELIQEIEQLKNSLKEDENKKKIIEECIEEVKKLKEEIEYLKNWLYIYNEKIVENEKLKEENKEKIEKIKEENENLKKCLHGVMIIENIYNEKNEKLIEENEKLKEENKEKIEKLIEENENLNEFIIENIYNEKNEKLIEENKKLEKCLINSKDEPLLLKIIGENKQLKIHLDELERDYDEISNILRDEIENEFEEKLKNNCCICKDKTSNIVFISCGHLCVCSDCFNTLLKNSLKEDEDNVLQCPLCRGHYLGHIRIFK